MLIGFNTKIVFRTDAYLIIYDVFKFTFISVWYQYVLLRQGFLNGYSELCLRIVRIAIHDTQFSVPKVSCRLRLTGITARKIIFILK